MAMNLDSGKFGNICLEESTGTKMQNSPKLIQIYLPISCTKQPKIIPMPFLEVQKLRKKQTLFHKDDNAP